MIGPGTINPLCDATGCEPADLIKKLQEKKTNELSKK
jgi:DNA-binding Xre family transcriptional regulator